MIRLAGVLVALALAGLAKPALARPQTVPSDWTRVSCGSAGGAWRVVEGGGLGGKPQYAPDAWATYTYSCRVGGRLLVVRHRAEPAGSGPCSAAVNILVSAWVNGVKVISQEQLGDYTACVSSDGAERVVRISLTAKGLTICRAFAMPADKPEPRRCRAASMAGRRDPAYAPPKPRPPIRLRLTAGGAACKRWTAKLALLRRETDRSFATDEVPQAAGWRTVSNGQTFAYSKTARFDLDNDGTIDAVIWDGSGLRWRGHELGAPSSRISKGFGGKLYWYAVQPVRLDGRNLVYLRLHSRYGNLGNYDIYISDRADTSRALVEARPDGTTRLVCGWGPERLAEDAL
jgi:hypothetical protein